MTRTSRFLVAGVLVCLVLALVVSRWASDEPDGLERVAVDTGFSSEAEPHAFESGPLAGYEVEGGDDGGPGVAGVVGVAVVFATAGGLVALARRRTGSRRGGHDVSGPPVVDPASAT